MLHNLVYNDKNKQVELSSLSEGGFSNEDVKLLITTLQTMQSEVETLQQADILIGNEITRLTTKTNLLEQENKALTLRVLKLEQGL